MNIENIRANIATLEDQMTDAFDNDDVDTYGALTAEHAEYLAAYEAATGTEYYQSPQSPVEPVSEQSQTATAPGPVPVQPEWPQILEAWHHRFPGNSDTLDERALLDIIENPVLSDRERLLVQTLLAKVIDTHHLLAALAIQNLVGRALTRVVANTVRGNVTAQQKKNLDSVVASADVVIDNMTSDFQRFEQDALAQLQEIADRGMDATYLAKEMLSEHKKAKKRATATRVERLARIREALADEPQYMAAAEVKGLDEAHPLQDNDDE